MEIRVGLQRMWVVCCPDLTHHVLRDGRTFDKGGPFFDQMRIMRSTAASTEIVRSGRPHLRDH
jgi:hypothetical protein